MNEIDLQANKVHLQRGKLCFFLERMLNNHEKNNYILFLSLQNLQPIFLRERTKECIRERPPMP